MSDADATVLDELAKGAAGYVAGSAEGWILNSVVGNFGFPNDAEIGGYRDTLRQIAEEAAKIAGDLQNIEVELMVLDEDTKFGHLGDMVSRVQGNVASQMLTFHRLSKTSPTGTGTPAADLRDELVRAEMGPLNDIHNAMVTGALIARPGELGLLRIYADKCSRACLQDPAFTRKSFPPDSPLAANYKDLENYFQTLLSLQVQAMVLLFNAVNATGDNATAQSYLATFQQNLAIQCEEFLWAVESYVVACCIDDSLLDLFRNSDTNCDPIRQADAFVKNYSYSSDGVTVALQQSRTFRLRFWQATSSSPPPPRVSIGFNQLLGKEAGTAGREPYGPSILTLGEGVSLVSGSNVLATGVGTHVVFPAVDTVQWGLYRVPWPDLQDGTYSLNFAPGNRQLNALIDPFSSTAATYGSTISTPETVTYTFGPGNDPSDFHCHLYRRTASGGVQPGNGAVLNSFYNFTGGYTIEVWMQVYPSGAGLTAGGSPVTVTMITGSGATATFGILFNTDWTLEADLTFMDPDLLYEYYSRTDPLRSTLGDEGWHHVAAVLDGSGNITLYVDGQPIPQTTGGTSGAPQSGYGTNWSWSSAFVTIAYSLMANVSEVRLWNVVRSQSDIQSNMRRRWNVTARILDACLSLDTGTVRDLITGTVVSGEVIFNPILNAPPSVDWLTLPPGQSWVTRPAT